MSSISENNTKFLHSILTSNQSIVSNFEKLVPELSFDGENIRTWQYIVLKSFDSDFSYFIPLANHLLDNNYCVVDKTMVQFAALNGFKLESALNKMQEPLDAINEITKSSGFDEKLVVVNEPANQILNIVKKIISLSNDNDYNEVIKLFTSSNLDISKSKLFSKNNNILKI